MSNLSTSIAHTHPTRRPDTAPVAWAGLGFVVSVLVSVIAFPSAPGSASPAADLQRYYEQHNTIDVLSDLWSVAGVCILLVFLSGLATTAERRGNATAARVVAGAGVCGVACEALASAVELALATSVVHRHDPTLVAGLYSVASRMFATSLVMLGVALLAAAIGNAVPLPRLATMGTAVLVVAAGAGGFVNPGGTFVLLLVAEVALLGWATTAAIRMLRHGTQ